MTKSLLLLLLLLLLLAAVYGTSERSILRFVDRVAPYLRSHHRNNADDRQVNNFSGLRMNATEQVPILCGA